MASSIASPTQTYSFEQILTRITTDAQGSLSRIKEQALKTESIAKLIITLNMTKGIVPEINIYTFVRDGITIERKEVVHTRTHNYVMTIDLEDSNNKTFDIAKYSFQKEKDLISEFAKDALTLNVAISISAVGIKGRHFSVIPHSFRKNC